jgi:Ca-activated chloride channel family protein
MTFQPVLPAAVLITIAAALLVIRLLVLRQVLRHRGRDRRAVLRWCGMTLAVLLLMAAAARPTVGGDIGSLSAPRAEGGSNVNVFFIVDRSVDARVEDFGDRKSRMSGIRADIIALIDRYPQARFAVISFASRPAVEWPLSPDTWSLKPMIAGMAPYSGAPQEAVNAAAAGDTLRYKLLQAQSRYPQSENLVFYFGVGAPGSRGPQGRFDVGSTSVAGGAVLGYGPTSAINEPVLRALSDQLGVPYIHRDGGQGIGDVTSVADTGGADISAPGPTRVAEPLELYWAFAVPAAALLLVEMYLTIRWFRRRDVGL